MPRGKYVNHKGRSRHFTSPEELQQQEIEESSGNSSEENDNIDEEASTSKKSKAKEVESSGEEDSEEKSEDEDRGAKKGVASLIEIENPNRSVKKSAQKLSNLTISGEPPKPELSRREREQIEKQKARQRYEKLHAAGKTSEAKADLARLALIRQQRADAAAKREAEKKALEGKGGKA